MKIFREWNRARRSRSRLRRPGTRLDYAQWVSLYDTITPEIREGMRARVLALPQPTLISVLMPVFNPSPDWLRAAIESVRTQIWPHWQLCIADDCSTDQVVLALLREYAALDPRVRVTFRDVNGHISAASNTALESAEGEFTALFDHDDLLPEHALLCVAETIHRFPQAAVIYSDEDKIDDAGRRSEPYFKCDWNPDLARGYNMVSHLGVYRTTLLRDVGGFRVGYEGAQDYDVALRCIEAVAPHQVVHIPHVLYHWRIHGASTSAGNAVKPYALEAGRRAISDHLARLGLAAEVRAHPAGWYGVQYRLPPQPPCLGVVVLDDGGPDTLHECLRALSTRTWLANVRVIASGQDSRDVAAFPCGQGSVEWLLETDARGFAARCNLAASRLDCDVVVFLSSRCRPTQDNWAEWLLALALRPGTGAVGPRVLASDRTLASGALILGPDGARVLHKGLGANELGYFNRAQLLQNVSALGPACVAMRQQTFADVGGFDPAHQDAASAVIDLCLRLEQRALRNVWAPVVTMDAESGSRSRSGDASPIERDPAYSPNLSLARRLFDFAHPPRVRLDRPWFDI